MQYFIGLAAFTQEAPFNPSLMVHFRKRLNKNFINEINEMIAKEAAKPKSDDDDPPGGSKSDKSEKLPPADKTETLFFTKILLPMDYLKSTPPLIGKSNERQGKVKAARALRALRIALTFPSERITIKKQGRPLI